MKFLKKFSKLLLLVLSFTLLFSSCAASNKVKTKKDKIPLKSFVQVFYTVYKKVCTPRNPKNYDSYCYMAVGGGRGSGAIFAHSIEGSYIMTAAHICDSKRIPDWMVIQSMSEEEQEELKENLVKVFSIYDYDYYKHELEIIDFENSTDLCVGHVSGLFDKPIKLSKRGPRRGEKVINIAAPAGWFEPRTVPVLDGRFSGNTMFRRNHWRAVYTVPAVGGSSGSPILTSRGRLVGMISAVHIKFHHISISPVYKDVVRFLVDTINKDMRSKKKNEDGLVKRPDLF